METVFICEDGIYPWDQVTHSDDKDFLTLTLLNHDLIDAWPSWRSLELSLKEIWPAVVKWGTHGIKPYSKIQEYLALKEFADNSGPEAFLKKMK
jgi:hypothetical protein